MNRRGSSEEVEVNLSTMHFRTAERVYILGVQTEEIRRLRDERDLGHRKRVT